MHSDPSLGPTYEHLGYDLASIGFLHHFQAPAYELSRAKKLRKKTYMICKYTGVSKYSLILFQSNLYAVQVQYV